MDDATTPDGGGQTIQGVQVDDQGMAVPEPQTEAAVAEEGKEQSQPESTSQNDQQDQTEAVSELEASTKTKTEAETQAPDKTDEEILQWAEKKGLKIDPNNPTEVKLARMQLETDRKFHQSRVEPPQPIEETGDALYDEIIERQNRQEVQTYVRDWFEANPDMKEHREELQKIAQTRPWLTNMDDIKAHFLSDPATVSKFKQEGGREALTNLAQKQGAIPPTAAATNATSFESQKITPQNVDRLVAEHDHDWFVKNYDAINKAMEG